MTEAFVLPSEVEAAPEVVSPLDIPSMLIAEHLRDSIWTAAMSSPRSLQVSIGASEIGSGCDRQISYREHNVPALNFPDPMRSIIGLGTHLVLAEMMTRLDAGSGRYLIEKKVSYRGVPGTCDLFDRRTHTVIDWKSTLKSKIRLARKDGPNPGYRTQVHIYGAALEVEGEAVERVALAYVPVDAPLSEVYVWSEPFNRSIADVAIDRREALQGVLPADANPTPTRLCPWCSHYRPGSTDLAIGCPGTKE